MAIAALTLAGCGGSTKTAKDVAAQAPPTARTTSTSTKQAASYPTPGGAVSPGPTVTGTVRIGGYCTIKGAVGKTAQGRWATCTLRTGESRPRWVESGGTTSTGAVIPGAFCSQEGATGKSAAGNTYTCSKQGRETRARWHKS